MFFDPKWRSRQDALTRKALVAWLETKPADRRYCYHSNGHCLLATFFRAAGFKRIVVEPDRFSHAESFGHPVKLPRSFILIAALRPHTYGAALDRARNSVRT